MKKLTLLMLGILSILPQYAQLPKELTLEEALMDSTYRAGIDSAIQAAIGKPYPAFELVSLDGKVATEQDLRGKVTLINFWFSACAPCVKEMPYLEAFYNKYKNNPQVQLLSFARDHEAVARDAVAQYKIPYAVYTVGNDYLRLNFRSGFPTNIIVDRQGNMVYHQMGLSEESLPKLFEQVERIVEEHL